MRTVDKLIHNAMFQMEVSVGLFEIATDGDIVLTIGDIQNLERYILLLQKVINKQKILGKEK